MFQSNKEYNDFLIQSGVHTFLQETPNKLLETQENQSKSPEKKDVKKFEGNANLNKDEKHLSFEKILGTRTIKDVEINQIVGKNLIDNISYVIKTFKNINQLFEK